MSGNSSKSNSDKTAYVYQKAGNLINLLDKISNKYDVDWSYHNGTVEFNRMTTYTWSINAVPGNYSMQNNITNNVGLTGNNSSTTSSIGSGGSSSGGSNSSSQSGSSQGTQTLSFNTAGNLWTDISTTVKSMLSAEGKVTTSTSDSTLTVTDRPSVIRMVGRYIAKENEIIGRQVKLEVTVLTVSLTDTDSYGINWNAIVNGTQTGLKLASASGFSQSIGSSFIVTANSGDLNGSQLLVNALSSSDKTSLVTNATVITHNNQPVPLQSSTQQSYLASSETTLVTDAGSQTTLTPGVITTGFTMNVLPNILSNQQVNLQITINLSTLLSLDTKSIPSSSTSGGASIQLPSIATKSFMQKVSMNSGQTLVLSGFDQDSNSLSQSGVGKSSNWWLGGGPNNTKSRDMLVILVTPQVMETN